MSTMKAGSSSSMSYRFCGAVAALTASFVFFLNRPFLKRKSELIAELIGLRSVLLAAGAAAKPCLSDDVVASRLSCTWVPQTRAHVNELALINIRALVLGERKALKIAVPV